MTRKRSLPLLVLVPLVATVPLRAIAPQADAKAEEILKAARTALGGDDALAKVQSATVTGSSRRIMGEREFSSDVTLDLLLPDKFKRTEEMSFGQGGPSVTRVSAVNGTEVWDDGTNRGGGGFIMRMGGPDGGPGGPGGAGGAGREPTEEERSRFKQFQERRMKSERARYSLIWFLKSDAPVTYAGVAEAPDGKADVLEIKPEGAAPMKLFVDQESHKPLMLTYEGVLPRMIMRGQGQRPTPEEVEKMRKEPPQQVTYEVHFSEYKKVDGVLLPHLISQSVNGDVSEEFTIEKYKLNAPLKPADFAKKGS
jgi:hypothetical protein